MHWRSAPVRARPTHPVARALSVLRWYRRPVAGGLLLVALLVLISDRPSPAPPAAVVLTAARDLDAGSALAPADLVATRVPPGLVPDGALPADRQEWHGRTVALPVRRGEILTDARLLDVPLLDLLTPREAAPGDEQVAVPVRLADPASTTLVRVGDVVDVLGAGEGGGARVAATAARVLSVGVATDASPLGSSSATDPAGLLVLAATSADALSLARAAAVERLSVVIRRGDPLRAVP